MTNDQRIVEGTIVKSATAWGGVVFAKYLEAIGITSWGDFAAACAAVYSLILIGEWVYKKFKR
jgi:hypothetical protein